jgi:hypothetical protein
VFLRESHLTLKLDITLPTLQCWNDQYLMEIAYTHDYTKKTLSNINQCQLYLQVLTITDITTVKGTYVEITCYENKSATRRDQPSFPNSRGKLNKSTWHYWTTFLNTITNYKLRRLKSSLGKWIVPQSKMRPKFQSSENKNMCKKSIKYLKLILTLNTE